MWGRAGLKSHPILAPSPLRGGKTRVERSEKERVKRGQAKLSSLVSFPSFLYNYLALVALLSHTSS